MELVKKFLREEEGAQFVEYIIILGIMAMIAIFIGPKLKMIIGNLTDCANQKVIHGIFGGGTTYTCY